MRIVLGAWTHRTLVQLIDTTSSITDAGERIGMLSEHFLGTQYRESTLVGDIHTGEELVINLEAVDCLTFIEYVEALRLSSVFDDFPEMLKKVRYRKGMVSFRHRNHFFTDWPQYRQGCLRDVTREIGGSVTKTVLKRLNDREDGSCILPGIQPVQREIRYIPSGDVDTDMVNSLKTGDYAGMYTERAGLDVSHVGIVIRSGGSCRFRHASSSSEERGVVDRDFQEYISRKPGILVFRSQTEQGQVLR